MKRIMRASGFLLLPVVAVWAGSLFLEVGNAAANKEAKTLGAVLVARSIACHDPAKSVVTASVVQMDGAGIHRSELKVVPLHATGEFAVIGDVPKGSLLDLAVTNPDYKDFKPRVLLRSSRSGIEWTSAKRFFSVPPTDSDIKTLLGDVD